jgi:hypothetical protein
MKNVHKYAKFFGLVVLLGFHFQVVAVPHERMDTLYASPDNYYVQPGEVFLAPNGIYVLVDGTLIQIYTLCADERGIFVPSPEINQYLEWCPHCQSWYDRRQRHDNCKGPRD